MYAFIGIMKIELRTLPCTWLEVPLDDEYRIGCQALGLREKSTFCRVVQSWVAA
jgi:hypothetical protein